MNELEDFVQDFLAPERPPRKNGKPLIIPRGVEIHDDNRVVYERASALGDVLEEFSYLWKWKMRGLAVGLSKNEDLVRLAACEKYSPGFVEDIVENRAAGRRIDQVIERALDRAGIDQKADYGTAIHARTEPGNDGVDPDEKQQKDVESCWALWREMGVVHLGTEVFTANDAIGVAGTFDHLSYVPGYGIIVTDKKTSSKVKKTYDIQLADYANSDVYDVNTDERMTLEEFIASKGWDPALLNRDVGLIWWVKNGKTEARFLDLKVGWEWAQLASRILKERRTLGVAKNVTVEAKKTAKKQRLDLLAAISSAPSKDAILGIWNHPTAQAIWMDEHTQAATARIEAL